MSCSADTGEYSVTNFDFFFDVNFPNLGLKPNINTKFLLTVAKITSIKENLEKIYKHFIDLVKFFQGGEISINC